MYPGNAYTCCSSQDVNTVYHPGETLRLHWIATRVMTTNPNPTRVTLTAQLNGPFVDEAHLKGNPTGGTTLLAPPIEATTTVGESHTSTISLPATLVPGYYNLTSATSVPSFHASGASIVRVEAVAGG
jgi:hypothetical protein